MHEFMHTLGLFHTHSRPDRDDYVDIKWSNIQSGKDGNFVKCDTCLTYNTGYDGKSLMHYASKDFSKNKKDTIESKVYSSLHAVFVFRTS